MFLKRAHHSHEKLGSQHDIFILFIVGIGSRSYMGSGMFLLQFGEAYIKRVSQRQRDRKCLCSRHNSNAHNYDKFETSFRNVTSGLDFGCSHFSSIRDQQTNFGTTTSQISMKFTAADRPQAIFTSNRMNTKNSFSFDSKAKGFATTDHSRTSFVGYTSNSANWMRNFMVLFRFLTIGQRTNFGEELQFNYFRFHTICNAQPKSDYDDYVSSAMHPQLNELSNSLATFAQFASINSTTKNQPMHHDYYFRFGFVLCRPQIISASMDISRRIQDTKPEVPFNVKFGPCMPDHRPLRTVIRNVTSDLVIKRHVFGITHCEYGIVSRTTEYDHSSISIVIFC
ncbi:hypothetical protein HA402_009539 [Bradysia odoriphaga]|nr:hypothetical protein HA402_009539 [Bradysia odoriphaga]